MMVMTPSDETALRKAWGTKVRDRRTARGLSQAGLAELTGLRIPTIWRIEVGQRYPSERVKHLIAGALSVPVGDLFPYSPTPPPMPQREDAA